MADYNDQYDQLKKELKEDAASVFAEMKKALHSKSLPIKKKQYPLKKEERKVLKVRVRPMEWKGRTKNRGGKYIKVIMEEEPPRLLMQETDGYNDIILMAKEALWNNPQMKEGTFTLCHADGTRWPIEDFEKEHASLSEIKDVWKKTFYIGRRPIEADSDQSRESYETEEMEEVSGLEHSIAEQKRNRKTNYVEEVVDCEDVQFEDLTFSESLCEIAPDRPKGAEAASAVPNQMLQPQPSSSATELDINSLYMPRLPYVGEEQIKVYEDYVIGSGNFGTVYRGSYQGTVAAIKKIPIQGSLNDITHEILVCTRLSHPHISRVMAVSKTDRAILIANEYIHGASLEKVLHGDDANFKLNEEEQCYIGLEVALVVEYIHSKNIIHQDIKQANILAKQRSKKALLTDWGLANVRDSVSLRLGSRTVAHVAGPQGGTALYMAPECMINFMQPSVKSDVWSLGATFLELFTGCYPWNVNNCRELSRLLLTEAMPHGLSSLNSPQKTIVCPCLNYSSDLRPPVSEVVQIFKGLDIINLEQRYGFKW
ncbi:uncharacterized protein LOC117405556 isoform X2 [Acipenser ruthenus]|nr:uncharacterized protein LOC117405556 isoform X2 [Acipenser ruthenus]XP_058885955.1 uncharacterized protein LOC117405556 isoform X2 [Acipenser ruthenus]